MNNRPVKSSPVKIHLVIQVKKIESIIKSYTYINLFLYNILYIQITFNYLTKNLNKS